MSFREDPIFNVCEMVAERIKSDAWFTDIAVFTEDQEEVGYKIQQYLALATPTNGKCGQAVLVRYPEIAPDSVNICDPPINLTPEILCLEHPLYNRFGNGTKKRASASARRLLRLMSHFSCGGYTDSFVPLSPYARTIETDLAPLALQCRFRAMELVQSNEPTVHRPRIVANGAEVTLTCPTPDAAIYYTLNGSYPRPGNAAALLYSGPFTIEGEVLVLAGAFKDFHLPSDVADLRFNLMGDELGGALGTETGDPIGLN